MQYHNERSMDKNKTYDIHLCAKLHIFTYLWGLTYMQVRLAERSKAPDLSSGSRMRAWVRTPHLTKSFFLIF